MSRKANALWCLRKFRWHLRHPYYSYLIYKSALNRNKKFYKELSQELMATTQRLQDQLWRAEQVNGGLIDKITNLEKAQDLTMKEAIRKIDMAVFEMLEHYNRCHNTSHIDYLIEQSKNLPEVEDVYHLADQIETLIQGLIGKRESLCPDCAGTGEISIDHDYKGGIIDSTVTCASCNGTGEKQ